MDSTRTLRFLIATLLIALGSARGFSQNAPIEWGEIPKADLEMKTYLPDTSAHAIILADYGQSAINSDLGITYKRHMRIKIFSAAGYDWGTHIITLYTKENWEKLDDLEGVTYSLGADGSIEKTDLEDDMIFDERADENHTRYRFTMPALRPGCVVEFRYTIKYHSWLVMPTWKFQHSVPTLWSEYRSLAPVTLAYAQVTTTYEPFLIKETVERATYIGGNTFFTGTGIIRCNESRWVMSDLPALKEEPYMTTLDDYIPKVQLQLAEFADPRGGRTRVLKTWDLLIEELLKNQDFGGLLDPGGSIRDLTESVIRGKTSPVEKMKAVYDYVRSTMNWDGRSTVFGSDLDDLLKAKKGDAADINFLLMAMLRSAGLTVDPVIASTRSHGLLTDVFPLIEQFNIVVARVKAEGSEYFLDATEPMRPAELVSPELLNVTGLVVKEGAVEWLKIASTRRYRHRSQALLALSEGGEIHGSVESSDEDYGALRKRRDAQEKKPIDIAKSIFSAEERGLTVDSAAVSGADSAAGTFRVSAMVTGASYAQAAGDRMYLNPIVLDRITASPFRLKKRNFPIDMSYGREVVSTSVIRVPAGFEPQELPKDIDLGGRDYRYTRRTIVAGDSIRTTTQLSFGVSVLPSEKYQSLREFYDRMVGVESDQIVLQRKAQSAARPKAAPSTKKAGKGAKK